jgi:predicted PurR-regulated permease PerM
MPTPTEQPDHYFAAAWRYFVRLVMLALSLYALYRLRSIITTLVIGAIIAYGINPMVHWMVKRKGFVNFHQKLGNLFSLKKAGRAGASKISRHNLRMAATAYALLLSVVILWKGTGFITQPFISEFKAAAVKDPVSGKTRMQMSIEEGVKNWDADKRVPDSLKSEQLKVQIQKSDVVVKAREAAGHVLPEALKKVAEGLTSIVEIVLLPVLVFYFLIDGRELKHEFISLTPKSRLHETVRMLNEFNRIMHAYILSQFLLCGLAGVVVGAGLALLGVQFPVTLGVLAGITRAIPIIGPIVGGIPIVLLSLTKGTGVALAVLSFFTILHLVESKFIMPLIIGDKMELHPVVIIIVLLVGGEVGGTLIGPPFGSLLGMFFAPPAAALIKVMIRRYWLARPNVAGAAKRPQKTAHRKH